jgi:hypothetical protein
LKALGACGGEVGIHLVELMVQIVHNVCPIILNHLGVILTEGNQFRKKKCAFFSASMSADLDDVIAEVKK